MTSTIHGAKGDEWEHVIVLGVTYGSIPFYRQIKRGDIEEERRLFYVAVTRERAYISSTHRFITRRRVSSFRMRRASSRLR
ncbi:3'-5' exonuclease [Paraburkholderia strydomiana]|uniref:3'-5' exonuclease n=1 Tax=Paraburkholderia strydomiana TaxID=1245417 RepID=UPI003334EE6E